MKARLLARLSLVALAASAIAVHAQSYKMVSETTVSGFPFPESVGCDAKAKVLYVSQFFSALKPAEKDGKGRISKVGLDGKVMEEQFLPANGEMLNKPKGIWVAGERLWVTDIDVVWVFDTRTKKGRKLELPEAKFANDPTVKGKTLYVSDNRGDALFKVEPADFLDAKVQPKVSRVASGQSVNPNGLYPARDGSILMVGFAGTDQKRGIYSLGADGKVKTLMKDAGALDGVYQGKGGTLLVTDWVSGSLFSWSAKDGKHELAKGFKGPADFCVMPEKQGLLVVVPDLVKSELRLVHLK
jgi:sugar lactone lactonase YvrE